MLSLKNSFSIPVYRKWDSNYLKFHGILINNVLLLGLSGVGKTTLSGKLRPGIFYFDEMIETSASKVHSYLIWQNHNRRKIIKKVLVVERNVSESPCPFSDFVTHLHSDFPFNRKEFLKRALRVFSFYKVVKTDINKVLEKHIYQI